MSSKNSREFIKTILELKEAKLNKTKKNDLNNNNKVE